MILDKAKMITKKDYAEKTMKKMKKNLAIHGESTSRCKADFNVQEEAVPAYLLECENTTRAKILNNTIKPKKDNVSELGLVTPAKKVESGKYAQATNNTENENGCIMMFYLFKVRSKIGGQINLSDDFNLLRMSNSQILRMTL